MMRKDVKLGFAIGGVLLAVLVVYVLVGTGSTDQSGGTGGAAIVTEDTAGKVAPGKIADASTPKPPVDSSTLNNANSIAANIGAPTTAPSNGMAANDANAKPADPNHDLWDSALNTGQLLISKTPDVPGGANDRNQITPVPPRATPVNGEETTGTASNIGTMASRTSVDAGGTPRGNDIIGSTPGGMSGSSLAGPATRPSDDLSVTSAVGQREHTVKSGETLSLIAQAAYGNANFYPAILRANPNLDPKKMKPGMSIILPAASDVNPKASNIGSASVPTEVNARTEYRVQSNDSLYRIAMKLYGKPEMVTKLYEMNKDTIGSDPAKLKLNMVLKLPEPPTQSASR
ncbi:MAG: LysM peptidoglycan-binding domain-containing protein [Anaerolineae bacterium]|nr:LysM peptidoglycan-binding domain-containing protein [Phycisphaerae bacterium]